MSLNKPASPVWLPNVARNGGGEDLYLEAEAAARYNSNPDQFAAEHYGFKTVEEYYRWADPNWRARRARRA